MVNPNEMREVLVRTHAMSVRSSATIVRVTARCVRESASFVRVAASSFDEGAGLPLMMSTFSLLRENRFRLPDEQRANLVPEIAAQHDDASEQQQVSAQRVSEIQRSVLGGEETKVRFDGTEHQRADEHHHPRAVARGAHL